MGQKQEALKQKTNGLSSLRDCMGLPMSWLQIATIKGQDALGTPDNHNSPAKKAFPAGL